MGINSTTTVDLAWLESATLDDLKAAMRIPAKLAEVNALLQTPEGNAISQEMLLDKDYVPKSKRVPTPEEAAQIAADQELAAAQAKWDEEEAARVAAEAAAPPPPVEEKKKIVVDYQVKDEATGQPIGRPTHIEGWTSEEVYEKLQAAHANAVRYAERVKKNKVHDIEGSTKQAQNAERIKGLEQEATAAVAEAASDPTKLVAAVRKVSAAEREAQIAEQTARARGVAVGNAWQADHKEDFLPCQANSNIIIGWLNANGLGATYENLELAFAATENQLVKPQPAPVEELHAPAVVNPPAVAPAPVAAQPSITAPAAEVAPTIEAAVPTVHQAPVATAPTPVAAPIAQPATRRPGVNGSLPPGSLTAARPSAQRTPPVSTQAEMLALIKDMPREEYRKKLKNPEFVAQLRAAGIPVVGNR